MCLKFKCLKGILHSTHTLKCAENSCEAEDSSVWRLQQHNGAI